MVVTRPPRKCCRHRLSRAAPGREGSAGLGLPVPTPAQHPALTFQACAMAQRSPWHVQMQEQSRLTGQASEADAQHQLQQEQGLPKEWGGAVVWTAQGRG